MERSGAEGGLRVWEGVQRCRNSVGGEGALENRGRPRGRAEQSRDAAKSCRLGGQEFTRSASVVKEPLTLSSLW